jgi:3-oxoacyl-(acyl-carrier-protein) synthase
MSPLFYIHQAYCISAQQTFLQADIETLLDPVEKKMKAIEPAYEGIPPGTLRRMGKAVRIGVGAAMPIIKNTDAINGIIIGTCNGGMEDCIKFLNQIIQYEEGLLAPGNFVQSTVNAVASQIGLFSHNRSYNITHVHRGLSFENSIIDTAMQLAENKEHNYLLGAVDEISDYNYNIDLLGHWYKNEDITASALYDTDSPGCVAGEGSAMFMVNNKSENAIAKIQAITILHSDEEDAVNNMLNGFIHNNFAAGERPDLLLSGENGDSRFLKYYRSCESITGKDTAVARFKHMTGEFTTATGPAVWLACQILKDQYIPGHMVKVNEGEKWIRSILIYNNHKGYQHSCILVSLP